MATQKSTESRFEIVGFEGGRFGRCIIETDHGLTRVAPAELMRCAHFGSLPAEDQERVRWLSARMLERLQQ